MQKTVSVRDTYQAAYLITLGYNYVGTSISPGNQVSVCFDFPDIPAIKEAMENYYKSPVMVYIPAFREQYKKLRSEIEAVKGEL